jgi:hypothetical protein
MGLAMGLYGPQTFDDLQRIREVRNAFAHSLWYITFSTPQVSERYEFHATKRLTVAAGGRRRAMCPVRASDNVHR